jgi:hypothetical protein
LDLDAEMRKAQEAKMLLENPLLVEAFDAIRKELSSSWENSPVRDTEGRELIFLGVRVLNQIQGMLQSHITTGKFAALQLQALGKDSGHELH